MPRSFLVKKVKLDEFSAGADMENAYRHRADLSLRLHDKGRWSRTRTRHEQVARATRGWVLWTGFPR